MTNTEFKEWLEEFCRLFPDLGAWLRGLQDETRRHIQLAWREALRDVDVVDASAVARQIVAGDAPAIKAYERELTAAHVRKLAQEYKARRLGLNRTLPEAPKRGRARGHEHEFTAGAIYAAAVKAIDAGHDPHEVLEAMLPPRGELNGPKYDCFTCKDSGLVDVWSRVAVQAVVDRDFEPRHHIAMACPCSCRAADRYVWRTSAVPPANWHGWRPEARYTPSKYCRCPDGDTENPEHIAALSEWVKDRQGEKYDAPPDGRVSAFDRWNRDEEEESVNA